MRKVTREIWNLIATDIIDTVEDNRFYGSDALTIKELEDLMRDYGIIEVIDDEEEN